MTELDVKRVIDDFDRCLSEHPELIDAGEEMYREFARAHNYPTQEAIGIVSTYIGALERVLGRLDPTKGFREQESAIHSRLTGQEGIDCKILEYAKLEILFQQRAHRGRSHPSP